MNRNSILLLLLLALTAFASPLHAQPSSQPYRQTFRAAVQARHFLTASPPLPQLYYKPGEWQLTLQPSFISGELGKGEFAGSDTQINSSQLDGGGLGISFSRAIADKWGWYVWGIGNTLTGKAEFSNPNVSVNSLSGTFMTVSGGLVYQFFGDEEGGFVLPVFIGPMLARTDISQTVTSTQLQADFDMEMVNTSPGVMAGVQAGINVGKSFKLNPFVVGGTWGFSECRSFKVKTIRQDVQNYSRGSAGDVCGAGKIPMDSFLVGLGMNLTYKPWGVSANITAPVVRNMLMGGTSDIDVMIISISKSFGNYRK